MATRRGRGRRLGIVLGGGGVRGLAHAGVLGALEHAGVRPSVIVGVSMGAVVGATYAAREDWAPALEAVDRTHLPAFTDPRENEGLELVRAALRSARRLAPTFWTWGRQGYEEYGRSTLAHLLGPVTTFADTRIVLGMVATDLHAGERVVLTEGALVPATLASAAIPGIARPVTLDGKLLVDGGFADPAPVDVARELGADVVLGVYTGQHLEPTATDNWLLTLLRGLEIGQRKFAEERLARADLVLRPEFTRRVNALNFSVIDDVVSRGVACGRANAAAVRALVEGR
ncbi:MAG TPA: patatin-like phospholipase family protein [Egibacteraceae bacterium]|nr:patatin-like phospholipase family protein [Egibacteraceae bacterium]